MRSTIIVSLFLVFISACNPTEPTSENIQKPNIIYMVADDLGYGDVSIHGQEKFSTPHIDKLGKEGMVMTQHYSGSTVCAPARSVLMTGLHVGHTYIRGNKSLEPEGQYPIPDSAKTVAEVMKEAGYVTGAFGKWGLGGPGSEGDPVYQGFDKFFGYNCQGLAHNFYPEYLWNNRDTVFLTGNKNRGTGDYSHDIIHEQALNFIDENKDNPFFLFLPYTIPHAEILAPEDSILEKFKGKFPEKPYKGYDEGPRYRKGPYGSQEYPHATFAAMVTRLDIAVGEITKKLRELGLEENTLVIFTSDNGPHMEGGADPDFFNSNGPFRGYKRNLTEGGIRVPTFAYWPGKIKPGSTTDHISGFQDFFPTAAELAGITINTKIDGISFLPTLLGNSQPAHDFLYWEFLERGGKQAVRKGKWKAIRKNVHEKPDGPLELYDLSSDPGESENLAENNPEVVAEMATLMEESHTENPIFKFAWEVGE